MNQILILLLLMLSLIFATIALHKSSEQPFYLKIEVEYGHGRQ
jgi:hypothetical protein